VSSPTHLANLFYNGLWSARSLHHRQRKPRPRVRARSASSNPVARSPHFDCGRKRALLDSGRIAALPTPCGPWRRSCIGRPESICERGVSEYSHYFAAADLGRYRVGATRSIGNAGSHIVVAGRAQLHDRVPAISPGDDVPEGVVTLRRKARRLALGRAASRYQPRFPVVASTTSARSCWPD